MLGWSLTKACGLYVRSCKDLTSICSLGKKHHEENDCRSNFLSQKLTVVTIFTCKGSFDFKIMAFGLSYSYQTLYKLSSHNPLTSKVSKLINSFGCENKPRSNELTVKLSCKRNSHIHGFKCFNLWINQNARGTILYALEFNSIS